jgi:Na+/melibiose symporter-like transporter
VLGIVIASAIPAVTAIYGHGIDHYTMALLGYAIIAMVPIFTVGALASVPEFKPQPAVRVRWIDSARTLLASKPFRLLCAAFVIINIGASVTNATLIFFIQHYLGRPDIVGPALLVSFASVLAGVPVWVRIARRIGKHRATAYSLIIAISLNLLVVLQLEPGDGWIYVPIMGVLGAAGAAFLTLPEGIVGDVIDYDTLTNGTPRGGLFFGVWSLFQKLAPAVAIGLVLPMLDLFGFDPSGTNDADTLETLKLFYCVGPVPFFLVGAWLLLQFPIDAKRHEIIRRRLAQRRERASRIKATPPGRDVPSTP